MYKRIVIDGVALPSVSKILDSISSKKVKQKFNGYDTFWPRGNAKKRGTLLHNAFRASLKNEKVPRITKAAAPFWPHILEALDTIDFDPCKAEWAEGPLHGLHPHTSIGGHATLWSRYAQGCPDGVLQLGGVRTLVELKSATAPYSAKQSSASSFKRDLAFLQLGAYARAWQFTVGTPIEAGLCIVVSPRSYQLLFLSQTELQRCSDHFDKVARRYHGIHNLQSLPPSCSSFSDSV